MFFILRNPTTFPIQNSIYQIYGKQYKKDKKNLMWTYITNKICLLPSDAS